MAEASSVAERNSGKRAQVHHIPTTRIVAVEHPGIVRNFDKGFKSLGGEAQLKHVLEHRVGDSKSNNKQNERPEPVAGVSLRPDDPLAKKIPSAGFDTRNVLIKVTLPKRTGRKRKRGSDDPFEEPTKPEKPSASTTASDLLQRLRDNESKYKIEAVGMLHETHRFRTLPDFQLRNADVPVMRHLRDHAMVPDYDRFKNFAIDMSSNPVDYTNMPGPPMFTAIDMPYDYKYRQPETLVYVQDEAGQITTQNLAIPSRRFIQAFAPDVHEVPMECPRPPPPWSTTGGNEVFMAVDLLRKLLEERPIVTKRVALNKLPPIGETTFKEAIQYVGYSFSAGPFRDSLIRYGVDPRKDPAYRFYQTLMFQVDRQAFKSDGMTLKVGAKPESEHTTLWSRPLRHTKDDPTTHIFDGKNITANGKTWQICDITDPIVYEVFHTENIRTECEPHQFGWYHNGTIGKGRAIMKDKMRCLFAGEPQIEQDYRLLVDKVPDIMTRETWQSAILERKYYGVHANTLSTDVRAIIKSMDRGAENREETEFKGQVDALRELDGSDEVDIYGEEVIAEGEGDFDQEPDEPAEDEGREDEVEMREQVGPPMIDPQLTEQ